MTFDSTVKENENMAITQMKPPAQPESEFNKLYAIKLDKDRIDQDLTVGQYVGLQEGNVKSIVQILSRCVWDKRKHTYLDPKLGQNIIYDLPLTEFNHVMRTLIDYIDEMAIPKENGELSE
jgi:hypothetical protein